MSEHTVQTEPAGPLDPAAQSAQWLEAGAVLPTDAPLPADAVVDRVVGRAYQHPAIPGRAVVRLVPEAVAAGADAEMGLLGFALAEQSPDLGVQRRRALGFPGQALLLDPARGRYALDVMKAFAGHAKRIATKPGHARDGFEAIAKELAGSVPHFLPSFWEEVGRAFADAGNIAYASQSFDKARVAEREYGLTVDESVRADAFLEFALRGALTVKSLTAYGKELARSSGASAAYERLYQLAVRRTLGGLPPWASMVKDLRALSKAAGRDVAADERCLLGELLEASATQRAPASLWRDLRAAAIGLARESATARRKLLDLFPTGGGSAYEWNRSDDNPFYGDWLDLLWDTGALSALWTPDAPEAALPTGGRGAWFARLLEWVPMGHGVPLQLIRRAAEVLRADGAPVAVFEGGWRRPLDLDVIDLLGELGLPWRLADEGPRIDLEEWAQWKSSDAWRELPPETRPRGLTWAAAEASIRPRLFDAIDEVFGNASFEGVAHLSPGLSELRRDWLVARVHALGHGGLAPTLHALRRLASATTAATFAEFPEQREALAAVSLVGALRRSLTTGVFEELGWPAFDDAMAASLLEAGRAARGDEQGGPAIVERALAPLGITDATLRRGVAHLVELAARLSWRLDAMRGARQDGVVTTAPTRSVLDTAVIPAVSSLGRFWAWGSSSVSAAIVSLGARLVRSDLSVNFEESRLAPQMWIGRIRGLAQCAVRPGLEAPAREALLETLEIWRHSGLADDGATFRMGKLVIDRIEPTWMLRDGDGLASSFWAGCHNGRRMWIDECYGEEEGPWTALFLECAPAYTPFDWPSARIESAREARIEGDGAWLETFVAEARARGPRTVSSEEAETVAEATGLSFAESCVLLAGFPASLDTESRKALGLKAAEVSAAARTFEALDFDARLDLLAAVAPDAPADHWTPRFAATLAEGYVARLGRAVSVPAALLAEAEKALGPEAGPMLRAVAGDPSLSLDRDKSASPDADTSDAPGFEPETLSVAARTLPWLWARLPVGDPLRGALPKVHAQLLERLRYSGLRLTESAYLDASDAKALLSLIGGTETVERDEDGDISSVTRVRGSITAVLDAYDDLEVHFCPSALTAAERELLTQLFARMGEPAPSLWIVDFLQSPELAAMMARTLDTPVPAGGYEQNPATSAPETVQAVADQHGLSVEAATLYLQLLAILSPTRKEILDWNGWTPKTYTKAAATLTDKGLVLEAKRARAGREHFLPGAWEDSRGAPPYEAWKAKLYGFDAAGYGWPLERPVLLMPLHRLFAAAWARCQSGDAPRFEEVRR